MAMFSKCPQCGYSAPKPLPSYNGWAKPWLEFIKDRIMKGRTATKIAEELWAEKRSEISRHVSDRGYYGLPTDMAGAVRHIAKIYGMKLAGGQARRFPHEEAARLYATG